MLKATSFLIFFLTFYSVGFSIQDSVERINFIPEYPFSEEIATQAELDTVPWKFQRAAAEHANKGDFRNALIYWDLATDPKVVAYSQDQVDSIFQMYSKVSAVDYILEAAKSHEVIIINEAHHNSFHREFTRSLLRDLFQLGYKNLGLEALGNGAYLDSLLNERKYPILQSGFYTQDPRFGNLIRDALELGYHVFSYETNIDYDGKLREIDQAQNIKEVIDRRPDEKFLIHVWYDHVLEGAHNAWEKAMASRLSELKEIDPLTIDQTKYAEKSLPEYSHPLLKSLKISESTILIDKDSIPLGFSRGKSYTDLTVYHPFTQYRKGRPTWLFSAEYLSVPISLTKIPISGPIMVLAYRIEEDFNTAIPVDIVELPAGSQTCLMALKPGAYALIITDKKQSFRVPLVVDPLKIEFVK